MIIASSIPEFPEDWIESIVSSDPGTVAGLVGTRFPLVVRVLHPAYRIRSSRREPVRWAELRETSDKPLDLASASFFEASGRLLHSGETGRGWDIEPTVGGLPLPALLTALRALGQYEPESEVDVGFWTGYRHVESLCDSRHRLKIGRRQYAMDRWSVSRLATLDSDRGPNLAWSAADAWLVVSDVDLPSSYVGGRADVVQRLFDTDLEAVLVGPDTRVWEPVQPP